MTPTDRSPTAGPTPPAESATLSVPASLRYARLVRLTTAAVGRQVGFDVEEIEDLRIAVDELVSVLVEAGTGDPGGSLDLHFALRADGVTVRGRAPVTTPPLLDDLTRTILAAVVDELSLGMADGSLDSAAGVTPGSTPGGTPGSTAASLGEFVFSKSLPGA